MIINTPGVHVTPEAKEIEVSPEVGNLLDAENVDEALKNVLYMKKIGHWELINDTAVNIPSTDFSADGTYPYQKVISQDILTITKEMLDRYNDFYISIENLHIDFTCVNVNASSSKYARKYSARINPSFLSDGGEITWEVACFGKDGETNVSKDLAGGKSYVFKKDVDVNGVLCLYDFIEIEINKKLIYHVGDWSHGDNGTVLSVDETGNIVFKAEISCQGYNSGNTYGAKGKGAFSGNIRVYGRKGYL